MPKDIYTEYTALPGHEARVEELIRKLTAAALGEPGILRFLPYTFNGHPRKYFVLERYINEAAFEVHVTSEKRRRFTEEISLLIEDHAAAMSPLKALH
ncbi:putative quinol monooxygenase [Sinomonas soli]